MIADAPALLAAIRAGDEAAFSALVRATQDGLRTYALRITGCAEAARDVVQDVFLALWVRRSHLGVHSAILSYLFRAVRNRALDVNKMSEASPVSNPDVAALGDAYRTRDDVTEQVVLCRELEAAVLRVLPELTVRCRQVFLLAGVLERPHAEVATQLGLAPSTVNYYLVQARKDILIHLHRRGFDVGTWLTEPDAFLREAPRGFRRVGKHPRSAVDVRATVDEARHDPEQPFAGVTVTVNGQPLENGSRDHTSPAEQASTHTDHLADAIDHSRPSRVE